MKILSLLIFVIITTTALSWDNIPAIPSNRRSQFYLRNSDGAYKYGYDSGDGLAAQQESSGDNQVEGFYTTQNADGRILKISYTAGVKGFKPVTSEVIGNAKSNSNAWNTQNQQQRKINPPSVLRTSSKNDESTHENSDASYQLSYNTGEHAREEMSDANGNVQGRYAYVDEAGQHDLSYIAGPDIGFQVTGGSLSIPNGVPDSSSSSMKQASRSFSKTNNEAKTWSPSGLNEPSSDNSYSFSYNTGEQKRTESSDASGNVQGRYAYTDEAGEHDLSYIAGANTGFVVTGGSLSDSHSLAGNTVTTKSQKNTWSQKPINVVGPSQFAQNSGNDGQAYAFAYKTDSQSRQETSDISGNVKGNYEVKTDGGHQQLEFQTGRSNKALENQPKAGSGEKQSTLRTSNFESDTQLEETHDEEPIPWQFPNDYRPYSLEKSVHPTFTLITPSTNQKSFEYGPKNAIVLGFLPPNHFEKHGYIYDTPN